MRTFRDLLRLIARNAGYDVTIKHLSEDNNQFWAISCATWVPAAIITNNTVMKLWIRFKNQRFGGTDYRMIKVSTSSWLFRRYKSFYLDDPIDCLSQVKNIDPGLIRALMTYQNPGSDGDHRWA